MTTGTDGEQPPSRAGAAAWDWLTASPVRVVYVAVALLLLLSWPFGGWGTAQADLPGTTPPGTEVFAAPFTVTVERAVVGPDLGPPFWPLDSGLDPAQADDQHLLLLLTVRNDSERTLPVSEVYRGLLEVRGVAEPVTSTGQPQPDVTAWGEVWTDHEAPRSLAALGPGLEHEILLHQPVSGTPPETLSVDLVERTYRQSILDDTMLWTDGTPLTTVTVPVETATGPIFALPGQER